MATDSDVSRRKHSRSPSDSELEKSSKRHKHRHRRHHRSKKHVEENKQTSGEDAPSPPPPAILPVSYGNRADDDIEEGEILDEEVSAAAVLNGVESGKDIDDSENLGHQLDSKGDSRTANSRAVEKHDKYACPSRTIKAGNHDKLPSGHDIQSKNNGRVTYYDKRVGTESQSPCQSGLKKKINHGTNEDRQGNSSNVRGSLGSCCDKYKESPRSESSDKHHDERHVRRRSKSRDHVRERSHSHLELEDEDHLKRRRRHGKNENDSDDERASKGSRDVRSSREYGLERDRESSVSYSRYPGWDERHGQHDSYGRDSRERSMDVDRRREKERERSWDRKMDRRKMPERERSQARESDRDRSWEKRHGTRDIDMEHEQKRNKEYGRSKNRELDPEKTREKEQAKDNDRREGSDWRREKDRGSDNYIGIDKGRDRYRGKERDRDRDWRNERRLGWKNDGNSGKSDSFENGGEKVKSIRDEDEQDDFEERMTLILAEQEDDELERIKEESRKRREAILEKYRNKQMEKDRLPSQHPGSGEGNIIQQNVNGRSEGSDTNVAAPTVSIAKSPPQNFIQVSDDTVSPGGLGEGTPKSERSEEQYCDDIFGETPTTVRKVGKVDGVPVVRSALHDNWDDAEGYYSHQFGEILDGRYEIVAIHGRGVFSTVVQAKVSEAGYDGPKEVAIKIIRNNETMNKISQVEVSILNKLAGADLENKRHCVRFLSHFKYRNHTCLVFESLHMNLRELLKKFGRNIGLKLTAVRAYAKQLFIALKHLRNCGVLHCDIKPDNMLVNKEMNVLKLCDFGNAMFSGKNEITPYLVSRFYRAPEIILGLPYDHPMDIWSVGCCLYELYTGRVLFPGSTNNDMLRLHMELKGPFPKKMLKKGAFVDQHFDKDLNFHAIEQDSVSDKIMKRMIVNVKPKDIGSIVKGSPGEDPKMLSNFKDLLEKVFILDPEKRMTVSQALNHPFITGK